VLSPDKRSAIAQVAHGWVILDLASGEPLAWRKVVGKTSVLHQNDIPYYFVTSEPVGLLALQDGMGCSVLRLDTAREILTMDRCSETLWDHLIFIGAPDLPRQPPVIPVSPDNECLDDELVAWDPGSGTPRTLRLESIPRPHGPAASAFTYPSGRCEKDPELFHLLSHPILSPSPARGRRVARVLMSPDQSKVAAFWLGFGTIGAVSLWNQGSLVGVWRGTIDCGWCLPDPGFSPDSKWFAFAGLVSESAPPRMFLADTTTGDVRPIDKPCDAGTGVFSSDSKWLAVGGETNVCMVEVEKRHVRWSKSLPKPSERCFHCQVLPEFSSGEKVVSATSIQGGMPSKVFTYSASDGRSLSSTVPVIVAEESFPRPSNVIAACEQLCIRGGYVLPRKYCRP